MERSADMGSFSDDCVINTYGGSSSFDDSHEGDIGLGVRPYQFDPEVDTDEEIPPPNSPDRHVERVGNNDWCTCGHCPSMPTNAESVCCREIQQVSAVINGEPGKCCITELTDFAPACLQRTVLRIAYFAYRQQYKKFQRAMGDSDTSIIVN